MSDEPVKQLRHRINSGALYEEIEGMDRDRLEAFAADVCERYCDIAERLLRKAKLH